VWDVAERWLPVDEPRIAPLEIARRLLERQLRARGVARVGRLGLAFDGPSPGRERALEQLHEEGVVVEATVEGSGGRWVVHRDALDARFRPRTVLLSPFDPLISDRDRTEQLFGFRFRLEIYVPKEQRRHGYFVMPILHGDRFVGRIDPRFDREAGILRVNAVHAEPEAGSASGEAVVRSIRALARWLGARRIDMPRTLPRPWSGPLGSLRG
jgi:uncharacterized protein YcaQ